jgi:DNA-directed RNA polymerase specialized sigma24 family protein
VAFPTTHWSLLAAATLNGDPAGRAALARICADYRAPVINFLRSRGYSPEGAEDLTQEFFFQLLSSAAWKRAERARGRFRAFLLGTLVHVLDHAREREQAAKRGGGLDVESLDALMASGIEPVPIPPDAGRIFDREWALNLVENALAAVKEDFAGERGADFAVLKRFLPGADLSLSYEEAADALGVPVATAKTWVHRLRLRFRQHLRAAVALTVSAPHEIDAELAYLREMLGSAAETSVQETGRKKQ